ncbi:sulfatase [Rhabdobacter roseus]|uniref:Putative sulfatase n=1 Tax=Rhabdobacter roseus TaxID=1655419 RepID=A0A840TUE3_9BACT|nr:sulfatase [Rhabdobacter roseus]MBB5283610.1 putative sulfatase [Rhabdobacter roseus]
MVLPQKYLKYLACLFIPITFLSTSARSQSTTRPNIVWIVSDDLGVELSCYGDPYVATPHVDRLAREGVRFTNAQAVAPVCSPSRSAFMTGMYPQVIGSQHHRTVDRQPLPAPVRPITEYFREAGYYVCNGDARAALKKPGKTDFNFAGENFFDGSDWSGRQPGQPFFAQVQIFQPHRAFQHDPARPIPYANLKLPPYYPEHPLAQWDWAMYLESVQRMDQQVGEVLERLEKEGILDNTIIIFFGDHGRPHVRDKQFLYEGGTHIPLVVRFPDQRRAGSVRSELIATTDLPATSLALAGLPVPAHLMGKDIFDRRFKRRQLVLATDRKDETVDRIRGVRETRYKYLRNYYPERPYMQPNQYKRYEYPVYPLLFELQKAGKLTPEQQLFMAEKRPAEELYDLQNDPYELRNLAADPKYLKHLRRLRQACDDWVATYDQSTYPEPDEVLQKVQKQMDTYYSERARRLGEPYGTSDAELLDYWLKQMKQP